MREIPCSVGLKNAQFQVSFCCVLSIVRFDLSQGFPACFTDVGSGRTCRGDGVHQSPYLLAVACASADLLAGAARLRHGPLRSSVGHDSAAKWRAWTSIAGGIEQRFWL